MNAQRTISWLLALAATASLAACSSGSSSGGSSASPKPSKSAAASGASATQKQIESNWAAFFNAKTPATKRISLLQDGQVFGSIIKAQAHSTLASEATAKVTKVTVQSATMAKVTYSILLSGQPVLSNKSGVAIYQDHTWKVGVASFCGLLATENNGNTSKLPAACKAAG